MNKFIIMFSILVAASFSKVCAARQVENSLRVPVELLTQVFTTNHSVPQIVRVMVLEDIYDPNGTRILIRKNSVGIGLTNDMNEKTAKLNITIEKILEPSGGMIEKDFQVNSADGSPGLSGQVFDMQGVKIFGNYVSNFNVKTMRLFSMQSIEQFSSSNNYPDSNSLPFKDVDVKLATCIFYAPKGLPMILYYKK
jgi:hypothetical protein